MLFQQSYRHVQYQTSSKKLRDNLQLKFFRPHGSKPCTYATITMTSSCFVDLQHNVLLPNDSKSAGKSENIFNFLSLFSLSYKTTHVTTVHPTKDGIPVTYLYWIIPMKKKNKERERKRHNIEKRNRIFKFNRISKTDIIASTREIVVKLKRKRRSKKKKTCCPKVKLDEGETEISKV